MYVAGCKVSHKTCDFRYTTPADFSIEGACWYSHDLSLEPLLSDSISEPEDEKSRQMKSPAAPILPRPVRGPERPGWPTNISGFAPGVLLCAKFTKGECDKGNRSQ